MDNFPYCDTSYCPRRLDCQSQAGIQTLLLAQSDDLRMMQNHCQYIVRQYKNTLHKDLYTEELHILTPLELLQKYRET